MTWSVEFHPEARAELLEAHDWYAERNPTAGDAFFVEVDRVISSIAETPHTWPRHLEGTHRFWCGASRIP